MDAFTKKEDLEKLEGAEREKVEVGLTKIQDRLYDAAKHLTTLDTAVIAFVIAFNKIGSQNFAFP